MFPNETAQSGEFSYSAAYNNNKFITMKPVMIDKGSQYQFDSVILAKKIVFKKVQ